MRRQAGAAPGMMATRPFKPVSLNLTTWKVIRLAIGH